MNCQRNLKSILPIQLPHKCSNIVARFIHNYFESPNKYWVNTFRFRLQDRCSSKQSDWFDSQFQNQLSNDICEGGKLIGTEIKQPLHLLDRSRNNTKIKANVILF
jgi:hypothetical protein